MNETVSRRPAAVESLIQSVSDLQHRRALFPQLSTVRASTSVPQVVVVGVSGGKDSICLLHLLCELAIPWTLELHVANCNHNLRPTAERDSRFVEQIANAWHLPFHRTDLDPTALKKAPDGLESAARRARYHFLAATANVVTPADQFPLIAIAHQREDQAETLLMNLIRGAGIDGLGAMAYSTEYQTSPPLRNVRIVRPLLDVFGSQIVDYLVAINQNWQEDETNLDQNRYRNRVRHHLLPILRELNPQVVAAVARTAGILRDEALRLDELDTHNYQAVSLSAPRQSVSTTNASAALCDTQRNRDEAQRQVFDLNAFQAFSLAAQRGIVRTALKRLQIDRRDVGMADIDAMIWRLRSNVPTGGPYTLSGRFSWSVAGATASDPARVSIHRTDALPFAPDHPFLLTGSYRIEIKTEPAHQPERTNVQVVSTERMEKFDAPLPCPGVLLIPGNWMLTCERLPVAQLPADWSQPGPWRVFLDAAQIGQPALTVASRGIRFAPFGLRGRHKRLGDYFTDHKVPLALRSGWPILTDTISQEILWVCGYEIAYFVRITGSTADVLSLAWSLRPSTPEP